MRERWPSLAPFDEIGSLLDFQRRADEDFARRETVLRALITEVQQKGGTAETAQIIVMLALWPGLDAVHRRLLWYYRSDPEALAADLASRLSLGIATMDLEQVSWTAATLLRNLERDLRRALIRDGSHADHEDIDDKPVASENTDLAARLTFMDLRRLIGAEAELVTAIAIEGESQIDAAVRLGLTHDALRKRYQRALARLKVRLQE